MSNHTKDLWFVGRFKSFDGLTGIPIRYVYRNEEETAQTRILISGGAGEKGYVYDCDADAERIVNCVNACAGMDDPASEITKLTKDRDELLEVLGLYANLKGIGLRAAIVLARVKSGL